MEPKTRKLVFIVGILIMTLIRLPYWRQARARPTVIDRKSARERILLALLSIGTGGLPLLYVVTPWLSFANYRLRPWAGWAGAASFAVGLWLLWRAHAALGPYWSDSLQLRQWHPLVTNDIYRHIQHPMYAFGWLMTIAQVLLLQNWITGPSGLVSFGLLYVSRVPREEQMMIDQFGEEYHAYMRRIGRIVPYLRRKSTARERRAVTP